MVVKAPRGQPTHKAGSKLNSLIITNNRSTRLCCFCVIAPAKPLSRMVHHMHYCNAETEMLTLECVDALCVHPQLATCTA